MITRAIQITLLFLLSSTCLADIEIESDHVGGYFANGVMDVEPTFQNYNVGHSTTITPGPGDPDPRVERRSFFVFDLSTVTGPIVSASLTLRLPLGGVVADEPMETFTLSSVVDPGTMMPFGATFVLDAGKDSSAAMPVFDVLGVDGLMTGYGAIDIGEADEGTGSFDDATEISIMLTSLAVDDINALIGTSEKLVIGGRLASHSFGPDTPTFEKSELLFSLTNVDVPMSTETPTVPKPILSLVAVPEPGAFMLVGFCSLIGWLLRYIRRSIG